MVQPGGPTKKIKTSDVIFDGLDLLKQGICPVLDDIYTSPLELVDVYVAEILNKKDASQIVRKVCDVFPLPNLQHLKRIRSKPGYNLEVIICVSNSNKSESEVFTATLFSNNVIPGLDVVSRSVSVPKTAPLTRNQYEFAITHWPTLFHEDKWIARALNGDLFTIEERNRIEEHMKTAIEVARGTFPMNEIERRRTVAVGSVIVDPSSNTVLARATDDTRDHPLKHSVMVCIDLIAVAQGGGAWSKASLNRELASVQKTVDTKSSLPYLCTGYDLYVTREPCLMCSMALLHSRIGRVFYGCENVESGALGSVYKIHTKKGLNHRFNVFKGVLRSECKLLNF